MYDAMRAERTAKQLYADHKAKRAIAPLPPDLAVPDLAQAYAVQDRLQALYLAEGGRKLAGWKIALTTSVMQKMVGVDHPCEGGIFSDRVHRGEARLKAADYVHLGVESEIAVELGRAAPAGGKPYTRASIAEHVAALLPAIEIVDDRSCVYGTLAAPFLIADNSFNFGCVVGAPVRDWRSIELVGAKGRMLINGAVVGEGKGGDVMGHPFEALAWLANSLNHRGKQLHAGDIVLMGSIVATKWLKPGDRMTTEVDGLGRASLVVE